MEWGLASCKRIVFDWVWRGRGMRSCLALSLILFSTVVGAAEVQTIKVDDAHIQMGLPEGEEGEYYSIEPTNEIILDATGYRFDAIPALASMKPNAIQVILDKRRQFTAYWEPGVSRYRLTGGTMLPRFKPFTGFKSGDQVVIGIGVLSSEGGERVFKVQWVGIVNVQ